MTNSQLPSHARVVKAHGAGNSFVVATDRFDEDNPSDAQVAALCSPAFGIGADGFIRAVERDGVWFMDYRNADGSKAEMCGNGVRVFVDHLRREGLVDLPVGQTLDVATRGGIKRVTPEADDEGAGARYRVDMGPAASPARETIQVSIPGIDGVLGGIWVDMPNPHTVVELADESALRGVFLPTVDVSLIPPAARPSYDPAPHSGTNLELVVDPRRPHPVGCRHPRGPGERGPRRRHRLVRRPTPDHGRVGVPHRPRDPGRGDPPILTVVPRQRRRRARRGPGLVEAEEGLTRGAPQ